MEGNPTWLVCLDCQEHSLTTLSNGHSMKLAILLAFTCDGLGGMQNRQTSTAVANIMASMAKVLPSYAWLTALPQLISRICHTNPEVNTVTNHIITHVAEAYPQQVRLHVFFDHCECQKYVDHFCPEVPHAWGNGQGREVGRGAKGSSRELTADGK